MKTSSEHQVSAGRLPPTNWTPLGSSLAGPGRGSSQGRGRPLDAKALAEEAEWLRDPSSRLKRWQLPQRSMAGAQKLNEAEWVYLRLVSADMHRQKERVGMTIINARLGVSVNHVGQNERWRQRSAQQIWLSTSGLIT